MDNKELFEDLPVPRAVLKLALPTVLSQLVTLIYNLADTFFVGHTNDPSQIAALTMSFPIFMCLTMIANLFGIGANSFISRSLGEKKRDNAMTASTFAFYSALIATGILALGLVIFMKPILYMLGATNAGTFDNTRTYISWTVISGGLPTVGAMMLGHLIRSEGNTKQASIGLAMGGILNIVLDALLVSVFDMGIRGAAIATCVSNVISCIYLLIVALGTRDSVILLDPRRFRIDKKIAGSVILVGMPAAAIIVLANTANILLTNSMSVYGDVSVAAQGIVQKVGSVGIQITVGLTQGIMPLLGYCYGAGNTKRFRSVCNLSFIILGIYAALCIAAAELFAEPVIGIFTGEADTIAKGIRFIRIWFLCVPGMCYGNLFCSIFQSMGKWLHSLMISVIRQLVLLIPLLIIFKMLMGESGLMSAQPVADTLTLLAGVIMYALLIKKNTTKAQ